MYIVIIFLGMIANPFGVMTKIRSGVMVILSPLSNIGYGVGVKYRSAVGLIADMGNLYAQNQELRATVRRLESENAYSMDIKKENQFLRTELDLLPREEYALIGADVIARDSLGGSQWVMIDKGREQGIEENMAVIVDDRVFVGYIDDVNQTVSRVRLITHPDSVVNVVGAKGGSEAIMRGNHGLSAVVEDIKKDDVVENGEMFITSSIGARFPRGLSVGHVQNVSTTEDQLFQKATIIPLVDLGDLRTLFVIKK